MPFMEGTILESGAGRSIFDRSGKGLAGTAIRRRAAGRTACGIGRQRGREAADLRHPAERRASAEKTAWRKRPRSCRKGMCRAREKLTKFAGKGKMGGEWGCGRGAGPVPQVFCRAGRAQQRRADEKFFRRRYFGKYSGRKALSTGRFGKDGPSRGESAPGGRGMLPRRREGNAPSRRERGTLSFPAALRGKRCARAGTQKNIGGAELPRCFVGADGATVRRSCFSAEKRFPAAFPGRRGKDPAFAHQPQSMRPTRVPA